MIYKVLMAGKTLARFEDNFEAARDYADRFPASENVEVEEPKVEAPKAEAETA